METTGLKGCRGSVLSNKAVDRRQGAVNVYRPSPGMQFLWRLRPRPVAVVEPEILAGFGSLGHPESSHFDSVHYQHAHPKRC